MRVWCGKSARICSGVGLALALAGCATTDTVYRPEQVIRIDHPAYTAELIRPETANFSKRNARFVEGGWLLGLTPTSTGENVFHDRSVISGHNARGCPVEFLDALPIGNNRYLRIGVGIVSRKSASDRFHDRVRQRFPWYSKVTTDAAGSTVHFYQFVPRYYFYSRIVTFSNASRQILFEDRLENLGGAPLKSRAFFHPFFRLPLTAEPWCRLDDRADLANPEHPPLPGEGEAYFTTRDVPAGKTWFVCGADRALAALRVEGAREAGFWRERRGDVHVFAVEPFVDIEVPPGETKQWRWEIAVP